MLTRDEGGREGGVSDGWASDPGEHDGCRAERARVARAFVGGGLGPGHPCGAGAVLLVGELVGNSMRHSGSGAAGETVTVAVRAGDGVVRVEVADRAGPGVLRLRLADHDTEGGRGRQLVAS